MRGWITLKKQSIHIGDTIVVQCVYVQKIWHGKGILRWEKQYREVKRLKEKDHWQLIENRDWCSEEVLGRTHP